MTTLTLAGPPGLVIGDFQFRLYLDGVQQALPTLTVAETATDAETSVYLITGHPQGGFGHFYDLTAVVGDTTVVESWPSQAKYRPGFVLPLRKAGVSLSDLGPALFLGNEEVSTAGLSLTALPGSPPDYYISGLDVPPAGMQYALSIGFESSRHVFRSPGLVALETAVTPSDDLVGWMGTDLSVVRSILAPVVPDVGDGWLGTFLLRESIQPRPEAGGLRSAAPSCWARFAITDFETLGTLSCETEPSRSFTVWLFAHVEVGLERLGERILATLTAALDAARLTYPRYKFVLKRAKDGSGLESDEEYPGFIVLARTVPAWGNVG